MYPDERILFPPAHQSDLNADLTYGDTVGLIHFGRYFSQLSLPFWVTSYIMFLFVSETNNNFVQKLKPCLQFSKELKRVLQFTLIQDKVGK